MTDKEALKLALEALKDFSITDKKAFEASKAIKKALAQPEQEPVAWQWLDTATFRKKIPPTGESECWNPLYTSPPKREWVGLTDKEIYYFCHLAYTGDEEFLLTVEAKLKEKNT